MRKRQVKVPEKTDPGAQWKGKRLNKEKEREEIEPRRNKGEGTRKDKEGQMALTDIQLAKTTTVAAAAASGAATKAAAVTSGSPLSSVASASAARGQYTAT